MITDLIFHQNITAIKCSKNSFVSVFNIMPIIYQILSFIFKRKLHAYIVEIKDPYILLYDFLKFVELSGYKYKFYDKFSVKGIFYTEGKFKKLTSVLCRIREDNNIIIEVHFNFSDGMYTYKVLDNGNTLSCISSSILDKNIFSKLKKIIYSETMRIYKLNINSL